MPIAAILSRCFLLAALMDGLASDLLRGRDVRGSSNFPFSEDVALTVQIPAGLWNLLIAFSTLVIVTTFNSAEQRPAEIAAGFNAGPSGLPRVSNSDSHQVLPLFPDCPAPDSSHGQ